MLANRPPTHVISPISICQVWTTYNSCVIWANSALKWGEEEEGGVILISGENPRLLESAKQLANSINSTSSAVSTNPCKPTYNFSAHTLTRLELPEFLSETRNNTGLPPEKLIVEITESALNQDAKISLNIMTRLRLKGFGLSIDDFGTGFSSLDQLKKIPFTELKIDQSFVHQSSKNQASLAILESSIQLAKKLDIFSVAEGVEDQADWDLIEKLGCDVAQGYLIAKPMPAKDLIPWAKAYRLYHHA